VRGIMPGRGSWCPGQYPYKPGLYVLEFANSGGTTHAPAGGEPVVGEYTQGA
jgi:hypothetical protein